MKKRVFIVHCWEGRPNYAWYPWLKKQLEECDFEVFVPTMPETNTPTFEKWLSHLAKIVGELRETDIFVGHSLGCITILRLLEGLKEGEKVGGAIFVAGFTDNLGYQEIDSFFTAPINFKKIKSHCGKFVAVHSDNDPYVPLKHGDIFKEKLGAKLIKMHKMKHFSEDDGITELPIVLEELLNL